MIRRPRGLTLIELMISIVLMSALGTAAILIFNVVLRSWSVQTERQGTDIQLDRAVEEVVRDLRQATQIQSVSGYDEIRYTQDGSNFYIFYLYNASDSYAPPPAFGQSSYQLWKGTLSGGISGTFTYGSGTLMASGILPPPTSDLSASGNLLTVDVSSKNGDETIQVRTQVRPRNL